MTEYDLHRTSRLCSVSGRELREGELFYSVLVQREDGLQRLDFAADVWTGPPEDAIATWKSRIPTRDHQRARMAPSDVLLQVFEELGEAPEQADLRYVLALLLIRRRVFRVEETTDEVAATGEVMTVYCPRNEQTYRVATPPIGPARLEVIQQELARLLFADSTPSSSSTEATPTEGSASSANRSES